MSAELLRIIRVGRGIGDTEVSTSRKKAVFRPRPGRSVTEINTLCLSPLSGGVRRSECHTLNPRIDVCVLGWGNNREKANLLMLPLWTLSKVTQGARSLSRTRIGLLGPRPPQRCHPPGHLGIIFRALTYGPEFQNWQG